MKIVKYKSETLQIRTPLYGTDIKADEKSGNIKINSVEMSDGSILDDQELPFNDGNSTNNIIENNEFCNYEEPCEYNCPTVDDFLNLTDEMIETILDLEEELVRWRQALIKYLPEKWAEGLRQDIFNNLSRDFEGEPAYDLYVRLKRGTDPQQSEERRARLYRLADGIDDTSITYL